MAKKNKPKSNNKKPSVHEDLKDMNIEVNKMGEIVKNYKVEEIIDFLDKKVKDKKLNKQ